MQNKVSDRTCVLRHKVTAQYPVGQSISFGKPPSDSLNPRLEGFWVTTQFRTITMLAKHLCYQEEVRLFPYSRAYAGPDYFLHKAKVGSRAL